MPWILLDFMTKALTAFSTKLPAEISVKYIHLYPYFKSVIEPLFDHRLKDETPKDLKRGYLSFRLRNVIEWSRLILLMEITIFQGYFFVWKKVVKPILLRY